MKYSEKGFEDWLKKAIKRFWSGRSHVVKIASPWCKGIPDLHVTMPEYGAMQIELKIEVVKSLDEYCVEVGLTPLQRQWIAKELKAGGVAGFILLVCDRNKKCGHVYASVSGKTTHIGKSKSSVIEESIGRVRAIGHDRADGKDSWWPLAGYATAGYEMSIETLKDLFQHLKEKDQ